MLKIEERLVDQSSVSPRYVNGPKKRSKRRDVTGASGLQFNDAGRFYRSRHPVQLSGKYGHLINLGKDYAGPVPTAYGGPISGAYLADPDADPTETNRGIVYDRRWRAAEVIAYEVLGSPPYGWVGAWVKHLDGDPSNLATENLAWATALPPNMKWRTTIRNLLVSEVVALRQFNRPSRGGTYQPHSGAMHPDPIMGERIDAPMRHRMVHKPLRRVAKWDPDYIPPASKAG
ncbi:hypothetical protein MycrhDRAFT_4127 [Mycolicibacterium rhodesiae JS60]|nr:hypothetical protein MycrhDRAFT_4127 [Mycolicibacterium rhodesiae JS60]